MTDIDLTAAIKAADDALRADNNAADVPQIVILCHLGRPRRSPASTDTTARILIETDSCQ